MLHTEWTVRPVSTIHSCVQSFIHPSMHAFTQWINQTISQSIDNSNNQSRHQTVSQPTKPSYTNGCMNLSIRESIPLHYVLFHVLAPLPVCLPFIHFSDFTLASMHAWMHSFIVILLVVCPVIHWSILSIIHSMACLSAWLLAHSSASCFFHSNIHSFPCSNIHSGIHWVLYVCVYSLVCPYLHSSIGSLVRAHAHPCVWPSLLQYKGAVCQQLERITAVIWVCTSNLLI